MRTVHRVLDPATFDPDAKNQCALAIMTKVPRAGFVKTRLVPPLTHEQAAELNICFLRDTGAAINGACEGNARGIGAYTPVGAEESYQNILPETFHLLPQRGNDFGERLQNAMADLFQIGFAAVCLIDSDSPTVPASVYGRAVELLSENKDRVIIGPSSDGGYYLIGMTKLRERLFQQIDWSTERVLEQTKERADELSLRTDMLPVFCDVDDHVGLQRLRNELLGGQISSSDVAPQTRQFLQDLVTHGTI